MLTSQDGSGSHWGYAWWIMPDATTHSPAKRIDRRKGRDIPAMKLKGSGHIPRAGTAKNGPRRRPPTSI